MLTRMRTMKMPPAAAAYTWVISMERLSERLRIEMDGKKRLKEYSVKRVREKGVRRAG
jgi:hypothetical protein